MGTNYYLMENVCSHCGKAEREKHIGKSSAGWCFALHVYPSEGIYDLLDWKALIYDSQNQIRDEYGAMLEGETMMAIIAERKWNRVWGKEPPAGYDSEAQFHAVNFSERGPNGLIRHKVQQSRIMDERQSFTNGCIAHGAGTWDCLVGEFS